MARYFLLALVLSSAVNAWCAEESLRTPSAQMKEAVGKLGKAPATIGKSLQGLAHSAKERLREALGRQADDGSKPEPVNLDLPENLPQSVPRTKKLEPHGMRDPFRPMTLQTRVVSRRRANLSPLERFELSQLKLVGIVWDIKEPRAMVEDSRGLGYTIKVGTAIGNNGGKVKAIQRNQIVIEETLVDVAGAQKTRNVSLKLPEE